MSNEKRPRRWLLLLLWVISTAIGGFVGSIMVVVVGFMTMGVGIIGSGLILGTSTGLAQWPFVYRYVMREHEHLGTIENSVHEILRWPVFTAAGAGAASFLLPCSLILLYPIFRGEEHILFLTSCALAGMAFGAFQWWVLKPYIKRAAWWILAAAISLLAGSFVSDIAIQFANEPLLKGLPRAGYVLNYREYTDIFITGIAITLVSAMITGITLISLIRTIPPTSTLPAYNSPQPPRSASPS